MSSGVWHIGFSLIDHVFNFNLVSLQQYNDFYFYEGAHT